MSVSENIFRVKTEIRKIEEKYGRIKNSVGLIAVSKTYPVESVSEAYSAGQIDFGENKVQEMVSKHAQIPDVRWHLIGHLQTNKVKFIIPFVYMIHSVDSQRLVETIQEQAQKHNRRINILLQIHISGEESKTGMGADEAESILNTAHLFPNIQFCGFMGMAALTEDRKLIQNQFAELRRLKERMSIISGVNINLQELSMGMSGDYELAIAEGATLVRIGTSVFGARS